MCRKNMLLGVALLAAGVGVLVSLLFSSVFVNILLAAGLIAAGCLLLNR